MLCKNAVYNDVLWKVYTPFDFKPITYLVHKFFNSNVLGAGW